EMVVKQDLRVVAEVRRFMRLVTGQCGLDDFGPCLVASELVTNAIQYAHASDDDVTLRLGWTDEGAMWRTVHYATSDVTHVLDIDAISETGRGLFIVDQFCRCWGVRPLAGDVGKVVFAVIDPS